MSLVWKSLSAPLVKSDFGSQCKDRVRPRRLGATGGLGLIRAPLYKERSLAFAAWCALVGYCWLVIWLACRMMR